MRADEVVIEAPCGEDWDRMRPEAGGQRRWCEHCERQVHDLSAMSEPAALAFLRETAGRDVCIAYFEGEDGEIVFAPGMTIVPIERLRRRPSPILEAAKLASAASLVAVLGACTPHGDDGQTIRVDGPSELSSAPAVVIPSEGDRSVGQASEVAQLIEADQPCDPPREPEPAATRPRKLPKKGKRKAGGPLLMRGVEDPLGGL